MTEKQNTLPLVAAQPGIWLADQLSPHRNAYAVAHLIDIPGELSQPVLSAAIISAMASADTLRMRYEEQDGEAVQIPGPLPAIVPEYYDLRQETNPGPSLKTTFAGISIAICVSPPANLCTGICYYRLAIRTGSGTSVITISPWMASVLPH